MSNAVMRDFFLPTSGLCNLNDEGGETDDLPSSSLKGDEMTTTEKSQHEQKRDLVDQFQRMNDLELCKLAAQGVDQMEKDADSLDRMGWELYPERDKHGLFDERSRSSSSFAEKLKGRIVNFLQRNCGANQMLLCYCMAEVFVYHEGTEVFLETAREEL